MANYRAIIETGLQRVMDYASTRAPKDTRLEWRPMDVSGSYPLQATRAYKSQILFRLSKSDLARCAEAEERWQDIRSVVDRQIRTLS
jgi:hypothetical protein